MNRLRLSLLAVAFTLAVSATQSAQKQSNSGEMSMTWWGPAPGAKQVSTGTVQAIASDAIAVKTAKGVRVFAINSQTKVFVQGEKSSVSNIKTGDACGVRYTSLRNNQMLAKAIHIRKTVLKGEVIGVEGAVVNLKTAQGQISVTTNASTVIHSHTYKGTLADLKSGYRVRVDLDSAVDSPVAKRIQFGPYQARGAVIAADSATVTVKTVNQKTLVLSTSQATGVLVRPRVGPNKWGTLDDIKVGLPVNIGFHRVENGGQLLWIDVLTGI